MNSSNVKSACDNADLVAPCPGSSSCPTSDAHCTVTSITDCNPMITVSMKICNGKHPDKCPALDGVYAYMGPAWRSLYDQQINSACGVEKGIWCTIGNDYADRFALCANMTTGMCFHNKFLMRTNCNKIYNLI